MTTTEQVPGTGLTTGWEPDTPDADSMLRRFLHCWASLCEAFARSHGGRTVRTAHFAASDSGRPGGWFNGATLLAPPPPGGFARVAEEVEALFAEGQGEVLLLSAWPTPDLSARGWHLHGYPPFMLRPPAAAVPPPVPPVPVVPVTDRAALAEWERVVVTGYPLPELQPVTPGRLVDPTLLDDPRASFTLSHEEGEAVSAAMLWEDVGLGCFALGVTLPPARGRGHWNAHAIHRLRAVENLWTAGIFSDWSRSPAEHLGFVPIMRLTLWGRPR